MYTLDSVKPTAADFHKPAVEGTTVEHLREEGKPPVLYPGRQGD